MNARDEHLVIALEAAVPLRIIELRNHTPRQRQAIANRAASIVGSQGDILQFGGGKRGEVARVFNTLAEGLACLAYAPGGVTFADRHWCVDHAVCTFADAEATDRPTAPPAESPRTVVDLELPA